MNTVWIPSTPKSMSSEPPASLLGGLSRPSRAELAEGRSLPAAERRLHLSVGQYSFLAAAAIAHARGSARLVRAGVPLVLSVVGNRGYFLQCGSVALG